MRSSAVALLIVGVLVFLAGVTFALQGMGMVGPPSSFMFNSGLWVTYGAIGAVVGIILVVSAIYLNSRRTRTPEPTIGEKNDMNAPTS